MKITEIEYIRKNVLSLSEGPRYYCPGVVVNLLTIMINAVEEIEQTITS